MGERERKQAIEIFKGKVTFCSQDAHRQFTSFPRMYVLLIRNIYATFAIF